MTPFLAVLMLQAPFVGKDVGLSWSFPGTAKWSNGRYDLIGKELRGEVNWFVAAKGHFDAEALYKSDTQKTKEADSAKEFTHVRTETTFARMPAISSDQKYLWKDAGVESLCIYAAQGNRAWVVRVWWPRESAKGRSLAAAFLKSCRLTSGGPTRLPTG